ncbi:hypothetical protein V6Z12_A05G391200 [Gossypium hirsutum]
MKKKPQTPPNALLYLIFDRRSGLALVTGLPRLRRGSRRPQWSGNQKSHFLQAFDFLSSLVTDFH